MILQGGVGWAITQSTSVVKDKIFLPAFSQFFLGKVKLRSDSGWFWLHYFHLQEELKNAVHLDRSPSLDSLKVEPKSNVPLFPWSNRNEMWNKKRRELKKPISKNCCITLLPPLQALACKREPVIQGKRSSQGLFWLL